VTFGFDLSPLARAADDLLAAAHAMRLETQKIAGLRARIAATRQELIHQALVQADDPLMEHTRLCLRRQLPVVVLERLADRLEDLLPQDQSERPAEEMSGSDNQNERHIQTTEESISVINTQTETEPDLASVANSCSEYKVYFPDTRPEWDSLINAAERLHGMLGIDTPVYRTAQNVLGQKAAAATVLCMLETINTIRKPGAYLRTLVSRAGQGTFNLPGLIHAARMARLSADNLVSG
jgi:replication initiation protein RepC